ncbi:MAG: hypothetical protein ACOVKV_07720, partial [Novosphingobium sp.]
YLRQTLRDHREPAAPAVAVAAAPVVRSTYSILFLPRSGYFSSGNDPAFPLRDLQRLGTIVDVLREDASRGRNQLAATI